MTGCGFRCPSNLAHSGGGARAYGGRFSTKQGSARVQFQRSQGRGKAADRDRKWSNSCPHSRQTWYVLALIVNTRLSC